MFETKNLYQNDIKWKNVLLGNQTKETIGSWGCLLTSMTMVVNAAGYHDETPASVNEKMKATGGFQDALIIPAVLPRIFPRVVYHSFEPCENHPAPLERIDAALNAGQPVIAQVDWRPVAGIQTHYVVLKERRNNDYVMYDPYQYRGDSPAKELLLTKRYKHQGTDPAQAITGVVWYKINGAQPEPVSKPQVPVPTVKFTVYPNVDGLALRAEPSINSYLYKRLSLNAPLISLEAKSAAQAKVGKQDQWLQVQDSQGDQGYAAAWYLSTSITPPPAPPVAISQPKVKTIVNLLTLRKQPVVIESNVIKRFPLGTELTLIEPGALSKLGINNQWVKVKDAQNDEGFVAAWFLEALPQPMEAMALEGFFDVFSFLPSLEQALQGIAENFKGIRLRKKTDATILNTILSQYPPTEELKG